MFLFNDTLNTFYLQLNGVGHMVKNHSDSERGNPLPPHGLLTFSVRSKKAGTRKLLDGVSTGCFTSTRNVLGNPSQPDPQSTLFITNAPYVIFL